MTLDVANVALLKEEKKVTVVTKQQFLTQLARAAQQKPKRLEKLLLPPLSRHCDCVFRCGREADIILKLLSLRILAMSCVCAHSFLKIAV